ncbi:S-adenosyl-L-methionine-dependent methyltransferase [Coniella lustricola]|uniref:S-adenosyl-L-methionine-dependent methyltransferase n=1 Tax=Coniella lustricola TaxID=2025994 RepID=A0A2T3A005_9PEZI|nr:S-adenosyl-L-methionine-dependent methyltransferase [Coniella lustricola]
MPIEKEDEQDRLDVQHHWWKLLLGNRLYLAPIRKAQEALDIGTGTGIWAIELAKQHPRMNVIGTDLSLIQPRDGLPANCTFEREDSEEQWVFDKQFDYIHWRLMLTCFNDFKYMINRVFEHLKPGGWAEFHESVFELLPADDVAAEFLAASALLQSFQYSLAAGARIGRDFNAAKQFKTWMMEVGFVDVVEKQFLSPVNSWPIDPKDREIGRWWSITKLLQNAGMPVEDIPAFQQRIREDVISKHMRVYHPLYVIYGRKPMRHEKTV